MERIGHQRQPGRPAFRVLKVRAPGDPGARLVAPVPAYLAVRARTSMEAASPLVTVPSGPNRPPACGLR